MFVLMFIIHCSPLLHFQQREREPPLLLPPPPAPYLPLAPGVLSRSQALLKIFCRTLLGPTDLQACGQSHTLDQQVLSVRLMTCGQTSWRSQKGCQGCRKNHSVCVCVCVCVCGLTYLGTKQQDVIESLQWQEEVCFVDPRVWGTYNMYCRSTSMGHI